MEPSNKGVFLNSVFKDIFYKTFFILLLISWFLKRSARNQDKEFLRNVVERSGTK